MTWGSFMSPAGKEQLLMPPVTVSPTPVKRPSDALWMLCCPEAGPKDTARYMRS